LLLNSDCTQAVFFDLGHTLLRFDGDFEPVVERSYLVLAEALARAGYPLQPKDFAIRFHDVIEDYFKSRDIDLIERPVEDFITAVASEFGVSNLPVAVTNSAMKEMYAVTETHWKLDPAAPPVLLELQRRGMKLGIITNAANAANANRLIDRNGLRDYFEVIVISAEERIRKPDARIYAHALERIQVPASSALMVGDSLTADVWGAQNAGLRAVWIKRELEFTKNLGGTITPDAEITSLAELPLLPLL
jgi:HAD superfamily hydrolase (TIGR01662 family)